MRRGNTAYLTRADGTLLSVPVTEIDREATAAANQAAAAAAPRAAPSRRRRPHRPRPPGPRADTSGPKAKVRITDADVSHPMDLGTPEEAKGEAAPAGAPGAARVEVADYTQELRGDALTVKGTLRNPTQTPAESVRMTVAAIDEKGEPIDSAERVPLEGKHRIRPDGRVHDHHQRGPEDGRHAALQPAVGRPEAARRPRPVPLRRRRPLEARRPPRRPGPPLTGAACSTRLPSRMRPPRRPPTARPATFPGPRARTTSPSLPAAETPGPPGDCAGRTRLRVAMHGPQSSAVHTLSRPCRAS